jgi:hypothetical protein
MDAIGQFTFLRLSNMPERMQGIWTRSARAGVNGVSLKFIGIGAEPFTVESMDFALNFAYAEGLYRSYQYATLAQPMQLMYGGVLEPNQLFQVLAVRPVSIRAIVAGYKPQDATLYQGICECQWTLQPIDITIQTP